MKGFSFKSRFIMGILIGVLFLAVPVALFSLDNPVRTYCIDNLIPVDSGLIMFIYAICPSFFIGLSVFVLLFVLNISYGTEIIEIKRILDHPRVFTVDSVINWNELVSDLKTPSTRGKKRISNLLKERKRKINIWIGDNKPDINDMNEIVEGLNELIEDGELYNEDEFRETNIRTEAKELLEKGLKRLSKNELKIFNRLLIESVLPISIAEDKRKDLERYAGNRNGLMSEIILTLRRQMSNPDIPIDTTEKIDSILGLFESNFDNLSKWMLYCANTLILLGLLGSFIGVNQAIKNLGDTHSFNTRTKITSSKVENENQIIKSGNWNRRRETPTLSANDTNESNIILQMRGVLSGLSTAFLSSIWGISFMIIIALLLTLSNHLSSTMILEAEKVSKNSLVYLYGPAIEGMKELTGNLVTAARELVDIKTAVTTLRECISGFVSSMDNVEKRIGSFRNEIDNFLKIHAKTHEANMETFKEELKNTFVDIKLAYGNNLRLLEDYNEKIGDIKGLMEQINDTNAKLNVTLLSVEKSTEIYSQNLEKSNILYNEIYPILLRSFQSSSLLLKGLVDAVKKLEEVGAGLNHFLSTANDLPKNIRENQNSMLILFADQMNQYITKIDDNDEKRKELFEKQYNIFLRNLNFARDENKTIFESIAAEMKESVLNIAKLDKQMEKIMEDQSERNLENFREIAKISIENIASCVEPLVNYRDIMFGTIEMMNRVLNKYQYPDISDDHMKV